MLCYFNGMAQKGHLMFSRIITAAALIAAPVVAVAQDGQNEVSFRLGLGPNLAPSYFGDADQDAGLGFKFSLETVKVGPLSREMGAASGLGFGGSLRYISGRDAADFEELAGLEDIDPALELGGSVKYSAPYYELFASLRYGAVGHKSFVSEIGGDMIYRPTDKLRMSIGPRFLWGDDTYANTYFGVTGEESEANEVFDPFEAGSGMISSGAELEAVYEVSENWQVIGTITYDRLRGDAANSPITQSDEQLSTQIVLTRKITFNF
ncbi:MAG: outer membrane scaffolding protein for murein synthesis (MipA/OmpV family) [Yoonia sp.]|jgi:outer membrane protein